jgi:hypothetical protein
MNPSAKPDSPPNDSPKQAGDLDSQSVQSGDTIASTSSVGPADAFATRVLLSDNSALATPSALGVQREGRLLSEEGYKLIKRLGSGSFGEVWHAKAPGGVDAAIKIITRPLDDQTSKKELQALELIKSLRHPYLLSTQSFWQQQDRLYIAMELADGTLTDRLKECVKEGSQGIPVEELLGYFREAAEAVDYLNSQNVQHRDIKPDNILLLKRHVKVADFGLARLQEDLMVGATTCGTPSYMPPEIWKGQISNSSDQYSLAATYVHLRRNRKPFDATALHQLCMSHIEEMPDLSPLPDAEQIVLLKALAKDPTQRYPNCTEFVRALGGALKPPEPIREPIPAPAPRLSRLTKALLVVLPLLVLGAFLFQMPKAPGTFIIDPLPSLLLSAGEQKPVTIQFARKGSREPIKLSFAGLPVGVAPIEEKLLGANEDSVEIQIAAEPKVAAGTTSTRVLAEQGENRQEAILEITTVPLPAGTQKVGTEISEPDIDGRIYWPRIVRDVGGNSVQFILIPKVGKEDPETFYIMENKVSRRLFKSFIETTPGIVWTAQDKPPMDDDFPALKVPCVSAYRFASEYLSGNLPTTAQWDRAAGLRRDAGKEEGPFQGKWDKSQKLDIALTAPRKVGSARDDISPTGCRDMAGNGSEWTRTIMGKTITVTDRITNDDLVLLRGKDLFAPDPHPLTYKDIQENNPGCLPPLNEPDNNVGFRVVLELEK